MNLFFGPAGRQFDSEQVQLKRLENEVRSLTASLEQQAVDQWLEPLANLFVAGMRNGIHAASNDREMRFSANPVVSVKVDDQNMNEVENRLFHQLISFLNQADSVEFILNVYPQSSLWAQFTTLGRYNWNINGTIKYS